MASYIPSKLVEASLVARRNVSQAWPSAALIKLCLQKTACVETLRSSETFIFLPDIWPRAFD